MFIRELKIGGRRESQICVTLLNPPPPRPQRNLCSSVKSVGHRCVKTGNTLAISDISLIFASCKVLNIRIMRTFNYNEIQNTPIWNEVKNWSDDRKNALITLLYSTMKGINPYEVPEDKVQAFVNDMPHEVLEMASEYAIKESRSGRGLSHSQAMEKIKEQRGWRNH